MRCFISSVTEAWPGAAVLRDARSYLATQQRRVGGLSLAEEPTDALKVPGDVWHDREPRIVIVEDSGGV